MWAFVKRLWGTIRRPSVHYSLGGLTLGGFIMGVLFWGAFNTAMELTNTETFCTGCHEMRDNVFAELKTTIHYTNRSGVRAICSDCHVPKEWNHKIKAKIMAVKDVYHELAGTISTPEKYEDHRLQMAAAVWKKMKASDSRECRNCHNFDYMDFTLQETRAASEHQRAIDNNMTCIDCHQGIAHSLPPGYLEEYQNVVGSLSFDDPNAIRAEASADGTAIQSFLDSRSE